MKTQLAFALLLPCLSLADAPGIETQLTPESPAIEISIDEISRDENGNGEIQAEPADNPADATQGTPVSLLRPVDFAVDYHIRYAAFSADISLKLNSQAVNNSYRIMATTEARGLAKLVRPGKMREEAHFVFDQDTLLSEHYVLDAGGSSEKESGELHFDRQQQIISSVYEGTPAELPLEGEVYDRISADVVVMMDLRNGRQPRELRIAEKNQIRNYTFTFQGEENIEVPAGTYRTVKYLRQRIGSSRSTLIWYAADANFVPVRMEQLKRGKTKVTSVATQLTVGE